MFCIRRWDLLTSQILACESSSSSICRKFPNANFYAFYLDVISTKLNFESTIELGLKNCIFLIFFRFFTHHHLELFTKTLNICLQPRIRVDHSSIFELGYLHRIRKKPHIYPVLSAFSPHHYNISSKVHQLHAQLILPIWLIYYMTPFHLHLLKKHTFMVTDRHTPPELSLY